MQMQKPSFLKGVGVGGDGAGKNKQVKDVLPPSPPSLPIEEEKDTDVKPQIIGGQDVHPPKKYPVSFILFLFDINIRLQKCLTFHLSVSVVNS